MFTMIPRSLYFRDNKCIGTYPSVAEHEATMKVIFLPTDHYDFIGPINPIGKSVDEINSLIEQHHQNNQTNYASSM